VNGKLAKKIRRSAEAMTIGKPTYYDEGHKADTAKSDHLNRYFFTGQVRLLSGCYRHTYNTLKKGVLKRKRAK